MDPRLMQMYEQQIAAQNDPWAMLGRMGAGILSSGGGPGAGNWFGRGAAAAMAPQQGAAQMGPLQMLQAETQLMRLEDARLKRQQESRERTRSESAIEEIRKSNPELAPWLDAGIDIPAGVLKNALAGDGPAPVLPQNMDPDIQQQVAGGAVPIKDGMQMQRKRDEFRMGQETKFGEDLNKATGAESQILTNWENVQTITPEDLNDPKNKSVDVELITRYNKMVKPTEAIMSDDVQNIVMANESVVSEYMKRIESGGRLKPEERVDLVQRMQTLAETAAQEYGRKRGQFEQRMKLYPNLNPERVFFGGPSEFRPHAAVLERQKAAQNEALRQEMRNRPSRQPPIGPGAMP